MKKAASGRGKFAQCILVLLEADIIDESVYDSAG